MNITSNPQDHPRNGAGRFTEKPRRAAEPVNLAHFVPDALAEAQAPADEHLAGDADPYTDMADPYADLNAAPVAACTSCGELSEVLDSDTDVELRPQSQFGPIVESPVQVLTLSCGHRNVTDLPA